MRHRCGPAEFDPRSLRDAVSFDLRRPPAQATEDDAHRGSKRARNEAVRTGNSVRRTDDDRIRSHVAGTVRTVAMPNSHPSEPGLHDILAEELATLLSEPAWIEFKPLFTQVYSNLLRRGAAGEGEESLRLGAYDKLRTLVRAGSVEKSGKAYRGKPDALSGTLAHAAADHCRELLTAVRCAERGGTRVKSRK